MNQENPRPRGDYPRMQIEWISKENGRVPYDGFYLVSNGKPGIGPFASEDDARAVQNGLPRPQVV